MNPTGWRTTSFVLGAACTVQLWRSCTASDPPAASDIRTASPALRVARIAQPACPAIADQPAPGPITAYGIALPGWAGWLAPHPGEDLRSYRDRMLPVAQAAVAPQRARVARGRDGFAQLANLDAHQRAELEAAAQDTAAALQDRVLAAVFNGELSPATFKPMTGVAVARDVLDIVARGNQRFVDSLHDDQRAALAHHPFDFGDYLVFATPWEDALKLLD
jgi:hypothetical protein